MDWLVLIGSGVFEAVWAIALGKSNGFKNITPTIIFILGNIISIAGLGYAMQTLPTGTSYAVWTATGASLTVIYGIITGEEKATLTRILLLLGIVACVVGLKVIA